VKADARKGAHAEADYTLSFMPCAIVSPLLFMQRLLRHARPRDIRSACARYARQPRVRVMQYACFMLMPQRRTAPARLFPAACRAQPARHADASACRARLPQRARGAMRALMRARLLARRDAPLFLRDVYECTAPPRYACSPPANSVASLFAPRPPPFMPMMLLVALPCHVVSSPLPMTLYRACYAHAPLEICAAPAAYDVIAGVL